MKFVIMYLICGILWGLWEVYYMVHIGGQFQEIITAAELDNDDDEENRKVIKIVKAASVIVLALIWPLVVLIDIPKIYIFDKIINKRH